MNLVWTGRVTIEPVRGAIRIEQGIGVLLRRKLQQLRFCWEGEVDWLYLGHLFVGWQRQRTFDSQR